MAITMAVLSVLAIGTTVADAQEGQGAYPGTPAMTRLVHQHASPKLRVEYDKAMRRRGIHVSSDAYARQHSSRAIKRKRSQ